MIFQNECSLASTLRLHPRWWFMSWWAQKWGLPTSSNKLGVVRKNHRIMRAFPLCFRIQLLGKRAMNVGATFRKLRSFARIGDSPIGGTPDTLPFFGLTPPMFGCSHHGVMYIFTHMEIEWNQYVYSNKDYIIIYIHIYLPMFVWHPPDVWQKNAFWLSSLFIAEEAPKFGPAHGLYRPKAGLIDVNCHKMTR